MANVWHRDMSYAPDVAVNIALEKSYPDINRGMGGVPLFEGLPMIDNTDKRNTLHPEGVRAIKEAEQYVRVLAADMIHLY